MNFSRSFGLTLPFQPPVFFDVALKLFADALLLLFCQFQSLNGFLASRESSVGHTSGQRRRTEYKGFMPKYDTLHTLFTTL